MHDISRRIAELSPRKRELLLQRINQTRGEAARPRINPCKRESTVFPLSFAQEQLWFLDQLVPASAAYNNAGAFHLGGVLQSAALEQSLQHLVHRHEILRTTFTTINDQPFQVLAPTLSISLPVVDLTALSADERNAEVRRLAMEEARRPFDLAAAPLMRASVLRLDVEEHVLLLTMHHIISDGWSMDVLVREMASLYAAFSNGQPSPLAALPIQYADYAVWQREQQQGAVQEERLNYWRQQMAGVPAILELPTDRPRPPTQSFCGETQSFTLPAAVADGLRALSQQDGATLFMTLLAAFQTLLCRYTGQEDLVVGSPIATRSQPELAGTIGFFANMLALRTDLSGNPSFREIVRRVRAVALGAYTHQDLPFERLIEELQSIRDPSRNPLVQVVFVLQNASSAPLELSGLTVRPIAIETRTAKFDLTLSMGETDQGLSGAMEYNTDLFDAAMIRRLVGHFQVLLKGIVADPTRRLAELPLLTEAERHQLLVTWNATAADYPHNACIHTLFEAQVKRTPDAVAVVYEGEQWTYDALNTRANQLAWSLQKLGVGPEVRVGLFVERSLEMVVGLLGILKAGGAYVPLDPAYPRERLAFMLADARVPVLLTQRRLVDRLPAHQADVVCLDVGWDATATADNGNLDSGVRPGNLAYVIYTSGSTGQPKGTLLEHRGLCNLAQAHIKAFDVRPDSRVLQFSSFSFDASVSEVAMALLAGATLCLGTQDSLLPGPNLIQSLRDRAITTVTLPPAVLAVLPDEDLPALRTIVSAGEVCTADIVARWAPGRRFFNAYGPTETTVCATIADDIDADGNQKPTIGRPIANVRVYLLDVHLQPVPVGVPGEIYIGGAGLARGYLNRPELTAERFVPDPFGPEPGARLYKTGDLARYWPDGTIEFLGRLDHQVKIHGFRIELGEIEAVLSQHPGVREAVVLAREDEPDAKRLVAYVCPAHESAPMIPMLRSYLQEKLPAYMMPSAIVVLEAVPLTSNGKMDRSALPIPETIRVVRADADGAPCTPVEEVLAGIWAQVLRIECVGIHDNFFELGGDSILSVQVIARARQVGVHLTATQVFAHQTIAKLARVVVTMSPVQAHQGIVSGAVLPSSDGDCAECTDG